MFNRGEWGYKSTDFKILEVAAGGREVDFRASGRAAPGFFLPILEAISARFLQITTSGAQRRVEIDFSGRQRRPKSDFRAV